MQRTGWRGDSDQLVGQPLEEKGPSTRFAEPIGPMSNEEEGQKAYSKASCPGSIVNPVTLPASLPLIVNLGACPYALRPWCIIRVAASSRHLSVCA
ncbi:hypothetical protein CBOM_08089 [Ceraceosorus bombacis]|uniref:Uncharacterized protein n=1 Tax=Ceraceosorus bombacis TaxID=401625 RepID=A0A0P1BRI3_9BASI|nr:hypothetical protein CBOM_08089 [Ceraceosorus bombacis]